MLANALVMRRDANLEFMKNDALTYLDSRKMVVLRKNGLKKENTKHVNATAKPGASGG